MGILSALLGQDNPAAKWAGENKNWLGAVGQSIAGGFRPVDYAAASERDQQQAQDAQKTNRTKAWLSQAFPDIAAQVDAGLPVEQGFSLALQQMGPKAQPDPIKLSAGDILFDPTTKQPIYTAPGGAADAPRVETRFNQQTGMQEKVQWNPQTGQWDAFGGQQAARGANDLTATETKQLFQTEDNIASAENVLSALDTAIALNKNSRSGFGADLGATVGANLPDWVPFLGGNEQIDANTLQLKNVVTEQALNQLKLIFGAAPTEGERKILLDIQGSVDQPAEVRARIFERAKQAAQTRLAFNQQRKAKIESGGYGQTVPADGGAPNMRGNGWQVVGVE